MLVRPAVCISFTKDTSRIALSYELGASARSHKVYTTVPAFPIENLSHSFSYMKYTLDTQLGVMSSTLIAISFPSTLCSWWYDP